MPVNALTNSFVLGATAGGVQWGTTIVTIFTFIILSALLKKFAWGPLKEVMDKRERDINKDIDDAEQAKLDPQLLGSECLMDYDLVIFQPFIHSLIDYIKIAFEQYIAISPDKEVEQIILSGDAAGVPQLDKGLQHQMGLPVTLANPFLSMPFSHSIDAEQLFKDAPQLMTACGLAMRSRTMTQIY